MGNLECGELKQTKCNLDGELVDERECPHHFYVVLSSNKYNKDYEHVIGVPFTSKPNIHTLNYGFDLTNDDLEGDFILDKKSWVLFDRVCRLRVNKKFKKNSQGDFIPKNKTKVKKTPLTKIKDRVKMFIGFGQQNK